MKGDMLSLILIITVTVSLTALVIGWAVMNMSGFLEMREIKAVKQEFSDCNDKIIETARTGLSNKCIFSVQSGKVTGTTNDMTYQITSREKVCDTSDWILIDPDKNIWQSCDISGRQSVFSLKWNNTQIKFRFESLGGVQVTGQSGKTVEVSRAAMNDTEIDLMLNIY